MNDKKSGDVPGIGKFVVLHDGSILVLEDQRDDGKRLLHKLDNPSGQVFTQELTPKTEEEK